MPPSADHRRYTSRTHDLRAAGTDTRPTSDRVRENVFNIVGPVDGASVLDLYAGSGAMGLEALSRVPSAPCSSNATRTRQR